MVSVPLDVDESLPAAVSVAIAVGYSLTGEQGPDMEFVRR